MQGGRDEEETEITLNVDFFSLIFSPVLYNSLFFYCHLLHLCSVFSFIRRAARFNQFDLFIEKLKKKQGKKEHLKYRCCKSN